MEREMDPSIQSNNGAPRGQGQPRRRGGRRGGQPIDQEPMGQGMPPEVGDAIRGPQLPGQGLVSQVVTNPMPQQPGPKVPPPPRQLGGYSNVGNMLGFNTALDYDNESAKNSMKNIFGQIASRYKAAPSMLDAVLNDPDFKAFFPNARKAQSSAGDQIDFGGQIDPHSGAAVGIVDVGGAFDPSNDSGAGWTWQDLANDVNGPAPAQSIYNLAQQQMGQPGGVDTANQLGQLDDNTLMMLLQSLMSDSEGQYY